MRKRKSTRANHSRKQRRTGREARAGRRILRSEKVGALPILNHFLQRLRLEEWLREHLPPKDKRVKVPAAMPASAARQRIVRRLRSSQGVSRPGDCPVRKDGGRASDTYPVSYGMQAAGGRR